jgi:hypothetical protein
MQVSKLLAMSKALSIYRSVPSFVGLGDQPEAYSGLIEAAAQWRKDGQFFSAGYAMSKVIYAAWGNLERMAEAQAAAINDFITIVNKEPESSLAAIGALHQLRGLVSQGSWLHDLDRSQIRNRTDAIASEMANRLLLLSQGLKNPESSLIRGILLSTDLDGVWTVDTPITEVHDGLERGGETVVMHVPSAFMLNVRIKDWLAAASIAASCDHGFVTPSLRAWRAVATAHQHPENMERGFNIAADEFAKDVHPATAEELHARGGSWSSVNVELWSRYFRSRARLLEALRVPAQLVEKLAQAAQAWGPTDVGYANPDALRLKQIVSALSSLVSNPSELNLEQSLKNYRFAMRVTGEREEDNHALEFLTQSAHAFQGLVTSPGLEVTTGRLSRALDALGYLSLGREEWRLSALRWQRAHNEQWRAE